MKNITRKMIAAVSGAVLSVVPMIGNFSANAAVGQYKTYVICSTANSANIAYFDFTFNYSANVTAEESTATSLCKNGYFSSSNNESSRKVLSTYNGPAIGTTGKVCETKFIVPMSTDSVFDVVSRSNVTVRNANGNTISPTYITMDEVLLGDVDLNGVVDERDADLIMNFISNRDKYPLSDKQRAAADVYQRGISGITVSDALEIQSYVQGQISHF